MEELYSPGSDMERTDRTSQLGIYRELKETFQMSEDEIEEFLKENPQFLPQDS